MGRADGTGIHTLPITGTPSSSITDLAWSPDGKWIYFSNSGNIGPAYVARIHSDGTGLETITSWLHDAAHRTVARLSLTPDSRWLLLSVDIPSASGASKAIYDVDTRHVTAANVFAEQATQAAGTAM